MSTPLRLAFGKVFTLFPLVVFVILVVFTFPLYSSATEPDPRYWRLEDIQAQFQSWESEYPDIFHIMSLGQSGLRQDIPLVRISDNATSSENEPRLFFHGALHANEPNGTTAIMKSLATLLEGYGQDARITQRVDELEMFFVPILNVDGHNYVFGGGEYWQDWRKTMRDNNNNGMIDYPEDGVDLNRNWDWNWNQYDGSDPSSLKYKGPFPFSEPEIVAVRDFVLQQRPVVVIDYHSPVTISWRNYIFWPWLDSGGGGMSPDADVAEEVAELWASATDNEYGSPYNEIFAYSTLPKEQCWVYGNTGILAYIMEISEQCWWSGAQVDTIGARVARGSMALVDRVLDGPGIMGTVTNETNGHPLLAEIKIHELHQDSVGPRMTDGDLGCYHRLLTPGQYTVTASCDGFDPVTKSISVTNQWELADFTLHSDLSPAPEPDSKEWLRLEQTVGSPHGVHLNLPAGSPSARVEVFDLRGHRVALLGDHLSAGKSHQLELPNRLSGGVYLVRAQAGTWQTVRRITVVP